MGLTALERTLFGILAMAAWAGACTREHSSGAPTPTSLPTPSPLSAPQPPATRPAPRAAEPTPVVEPGSAKEFVLTGKLATLLAGVRQAPDVRPDVVSQAAARLAAGDFNTAEAAAAAAAAVAQTLPKDGPAS